MTTKMAMKFAVSLLIFHVTSSVFDIANANDKSCRKNNKNHGSGSYSYSYCWNDKNGTRREDPRTIVVGGPHNWTYGIDYEDWATRNGPFYVKDTLVFKYPNNDHSVYLMSSPFWSYDKCDFSKAKQIANSSDGAGEGFKFVLQRTWPPYVFTCRENCRNGNMNLVVFPMQHW